MNPTKQFILFFFLLLPLFDFAQEFAPVGATWYYGAILGFYSNGYENIHSEKDTTIENIPCRKLIRSQTLYDDFWQQYNTQILPPMFVYDSSGVYYFFSNNHFSILYDFNKNPGESWISDGYSFSSNCGPIGNIHIDSSGIENINGTDLKWIAVHDSGVISPGYFGAGVRIYQRMGGMLFLFPLPACIICECDYKFRCYDDSTLHYSVTTCDSLYNSVPDIKTSSPIRIFPNPVRRILFVQTFSPGSTVIGIYDLLGRKESTTVIALINGTGEIDVSSLNEGIHFLKRDNQMQIFIKE